MVLSYEVKDKNIPKHFLGFEKNTIIKYKISCLDVIGSQILVFPKDKDKKKER